MAIFAITLSDLIEKGGSYAGLAAFFGLAVLAILYFAQAREVRRLREWAGRAPERAQELEERVVQQAESARRVVAEPIRRPGEPKPTVAAPATAAAQAAAVTETPPAEERTETSEDEDSAVEHPVIPVAATAAAPAQPAVAEGTPAEPAVAADADAEEETPAEDAEREAVGAGVVARAATPAATPGNGEGGVGGGASPALPQRATQGPPPRRPAPAAQPLRAPAPATRRPAPAKTPPRRPGSPPPIGRDAPQPGRRRSGIVAAGVLAGVTLIVVGLIAVLGGGGDDAPTSTTSTTPPPATETAAPGGGANDPEGTTQPSGPERAETSIAVLNGTTVPGLALGFHERLLELGYVAAQEPANWADSLRSASVVFYASSEFRSQAIAIAEELEVSDRRPIDEQAAALAPGSDVIVLVGADSAP